PAVAIGEQSENERAHRPEGERQPDRGGDIGVGLAEFLRDRRERHHDEEKIEGVERPAEEAGGDGGSLITGHGGGGCHWCPGRAASRLPPFRPFHDSEAVVRCAPLLLLASGFVTTLAAQTSGPPLPRAIAVLDLRFDGEHANVLEPGDTAVARAATSALLAALGAAPGVPVTDSARRGARVRAPHQTSHRGSGEAMRHPSRLPLPALLLATLALPAPAQETASDTLLTVNHYLDWEQVQDPQISPDGSQIIYTRRWV